MPMEIRTRYAGRQYKEHTLRGSLSYALSVAYGTLHRGFQIFVVQVFQDSPAVLLSLRGAEVLGAMITAAKTFLLMTHVELPWSASSSGCNSFRRSPSVCLLSLHFWRGLRGSSRKQPGRQRSTSGWNWPLHRRWRRRWTVPSWRSGVLSKICRSDLIIETGNMASWRSLDLWGAYRVSMASNRNKMSNVSC